MWGGELCCCRMYQVLSLVSSWCRPPLVDVTEVSRPATAPVYPRNNSLNIIIICISSWILFLTFSINSFYISNFTTKRFTPTWNSLTGLPRVPRTPATSRTCRVFYQYGGGRERSQLKIISLYKLS